MARQRILLVDDHEVARLGLRALIERQPDMEVVAEAAASAEAITKAVALKPDFLGVPITRKGERLGNLYLADKRTADEFMADDQHLIELLAAHAGVAIENARLYARVQRLSAVEERQRIGMDLHDGII